MSHKRKLATIIARIRGITSFRLFHDGAAHFKGSCELNVGRIKSGEYAQVCEKLSARKVMSDEFGYEGVCQFYLTSKHLFSLSFGMIFQVNWGEKTVH